MSSSPRETPNREAASFASRFLHSAPKPTGPRRWLHDVADLFFPDRCLLCGDVQTLPDLSVCPACLELCEPVTGPFCADCGAPLRQAGIEGRCLRCMESGTPLPLVQSRSLFVYLGPVHRLVLRAKSGDEHAAWVMSSLLRKAVPELLGAQTAFDAVTPVPQSLRRYLERGFGVTDMLAKETASELGVLFRAGLLERSSGGRNQVGLTREERLKNPWGQYRLKRGLALSGKKILLVDDVLTTGATLAACARCLLDAGAESVRGLTFARSE